MPRPAMSGAEPWVACAIAWLGPALRPGGEAEAADQAGGLVGEDIAEHVGGHDDIVFLRRHHQAHREGVDDGFVIVHVRVFRGDLRHSSTNMPQPSLKTVSLCTTVSCLRRERASSKASRATFADPLRVMTRTEIVDVMGRAELAAAGDDVAVRLEAFVILAHDDEVDILMHGGQRGIGCAGRILAKRSKCLRRIGCGLIASGIFG